MSQSRTKQHSLNRREASKKTPAKRPKTSGNDEIQTRISDLESISNGYEELLSHVLGDKEWRKNLRFVEDLETTVRKRQQAIMDTLNALVDERDRKGAPGEP